MTSTHTTTYTFTHTATFLADVIMSNMLGILVSLGIDSSRLRQDWNRDLSAIAAWIGERCLAKVVLECQRPDGTTAPIFEFPVRYESTGKGDESFVKDNAAIARYAAKLKSVPSGTTFRLVCTYNGEHSKQPGWSSTTRASTSALVSRSLGTIGSGPHASTSAIIYS